MASSPGHFELALNVADLAASLRFYTTLGFTVVAGSERSDVAVVQFEGFRIGLYRTHIPENRVTFRGGNVKRIADRARSQGLTFEEEPAVAQDGSTTALVRDPDGNAVSFVSPPRAPG